MRFFKLYRERKQSLLAVLVVAVWVVSPVLSVVHAALDVHSYCAEHGVVEEGAQYHGHGNGDAALLSVGSAQNEEPQDTSHTECAFADPAIREAVHQQAPVAAANAPSLELCDLIFAKALVVATLDPLGVAPKTSPPQAG